MKQTIVTALLLAALGCGQSAPVEQTPPENAVKFQAITGRADAWYSDGYPTLMWFNDTRNNVRDRSVNDSLIWLINQVPAGEWIKLTVYSLDDYAIASALSNKANQGVGVQVLGGRNFNWDANPATRLLRDNPRVARYNCNHVAGAGSCLGDNIMHAKVALFSRLWDGANSWPAVTWVSTANYDDWSNTRFNSAVAVYGDTTLFWGTGGMVKWFDQMVEQANPSSMNPYAYWNGSGYDYFDSGLPRGYAMSGRATLFASPEQGNDLLARRLNEVANLSGQCAIRVLHANISDERSAVTNRLKDLKNFYSCDIAVIVNGIEANALQTLKSAGICVRHNPYVHDKTILVTARWADRGNSYFSRVFTGSHNLQHPANYKNDEVFLRLEPNGNNAVWNAFWAHFEDVWHDPRTGGCL
jgi:hypothetical protein